MDPDETTRAGLATPVTAGAVCALVGFTSSFAVVLAGLRGMGASQAEAASGLLALTLLTGLGSLWLSWHHRRPLVLAWSTPGAALLAGTGVVAGGWRAACGAFALAGVLYLASGLWEGLAGLVRRIPTTIAQAMLAGVLMPICLSPVKALATHPRDIAPVLMVWLVVLRLASRWAVPAAFAAAALVVGVELRLGGRSVVASQLVPHLAATSPTLTWQAVVGVALPLWVVTMASQNIAGVAVVGSFGFTVPWRSSMVTTGLGTVLGALAGGHSINLAAISAALAAGPEAGPDKDRRWVAGVSTGVTYLVLGVCSAALATVVAMAPDGVAEAVAGLALMGTLAGALHGALDERSLASADADTGGAAARVAAERTAAVVTFVVAASGLALGGVGSAFWALVAGLVVRAWLLPGAGATRA